MSRSFRIDNPLEQFYSRADRENPDLLLDDISEVPGAPATREDNPPELNKDAGKRVTVDIQAPQAVKVIPGDVSTYLSENFHGWTATCASQIPKQVAAAQDHRTRIRVTNTEETNPVYIGSTAEESKADGYLLAAGKDIVIEATAAVWATLKTATPTDQALVTVLAEYAWPRG